jgi:hypothetical protein
MMTDKKPDQEKQVTPEGAVEVNEKDLEQAAGGAILGTSLAGEGKSVKIDFCKSDIGATDPINTDATFTEKEI